MVDIIIPVLNEERILEERDEYFQTLGQKANIIFVDGGSQDRTVELARRWGQAVISKRGRAVQMNQGAKFSSSDYLLFLHVDTWINPQVTSRIIEVLDNGCDAGCFQMTIDDPQWMFRIIEEIVNGRAKYFGVIDGDLGLFIKKDVFEGLGGFDEVPMMEDILFSKKLKNKYRIKILPSPIIVSSRKWYEQGFLKTLGAYAKAYLQFWFGMISPKVKYIET